MAISGGNIRILFFSSLLLIVGIHIFWHWPNGIIKHEKRNFLFFSIYIIFVIWICTISPTHLVDIFPDKQSPQYTGELITWKVSTQNYDCFDKCYFLFKWNFEKTDKFGSSGDPVEENSWTWNTSGLPAGKYYIKARVRENNQIIEELFDDEIEYIMPYELRIKSSIDSQANMSSNKPPQIISVTPPSYSNFQLDEKITLQISANDAENDQIYYQYLCQPTGWGSIINLSNGWTTNNECDWNALVPGDNQITISVKDQYHNSKDKYNSEYLIYHVNEEKPDKELDLNIPKNNSPEQMQCIVYINKSKNNGSDGINEFGDATENTSLEQNSSNYPQKIDATETGVNSLPCIHHLNLDKLGENKAGSTLLWTIDASDPDGDQIYNKVYLKGPSTNGIWVQKRDWNTNKEWSWKTDLTDLGQNYIKVQIIDEKHSETTSYDAELTQLIELFPVSGTTNESFKDNINNKKINLDDLAKLKTPGGWIINQSDNSMIEFEKEEHEIVFQDYYNKSDYTIKIKLDELGTPQEVIFIKGSDVLPMIPEAVSTYAIDKIKSYLY